MSTEAVLNHHLDALRSGDPDELAKDYGADSVLISPEGQIVGGAAIRAAFGEFLSGPFNPETFEFTIDATEINGEVAYIVWHGSTATHHIPLGTDTFVLRDGKIAMQTFAAHMVEK